MKVNLIIMIGSEEIIVIIAIIVAIFLFGFFVGKKAGYIKKSKGK